MDIITKLQELYADESKHSAYQNTPKFIREKLGYVELIDENWRGDSARWDYLRKNFDFRGQSVLDIGANTGFFALNIAHNEPTAEVTALEGNKNHADYIETIAEHFEMPNAHVLHQYLGHDDIRALDNYDTALLFNVLHHAGVDFDQPSMESKAGLSDYCVDYMRQLSQKCKQLIFQMGYNWGGNKQHPVVDLSDDAKKVIYTAKFMTNGGWNIERVLLPKTCSGNPYPAELSDIGNTAVTLMNTGRFDEAEKNLKPIIDPNIENISEFYRRPVFVCNSDLG